MWSDWLSSFLLIWSDVGAFSEVKRSTGINLIFIFDKNLQLIKYWYSVTLRTLRIFLLLNTLQIYFRRTYSLIFRLENSWSFWNIYCELLEMLTNFSSIFSDLWSFSLPMNSSITLINFRNLFFVRSPWIDYPFLDNDHLPQLLSLTIYLPITITSLVISPSCFSCYLPIFNLSPPHILIPLSPPHDD